MECHDIKDRNFISQYMSPVTTQYLHSKVTSDNCTPGSWCNSSVRKLTFPQVVLSPCT